MYYYFSAKFSAVLKINGVYYGEIDQIIKRIENLSNGAFIEVCPLELGCFPFSFILNDKFLFSPPSGVSVVDLKGGFLIEFNFLQDNSPFTILTQEKFPYAVVTAFKENGLKISIETPNDFFAETIGFFAEKSTITTFTLQGKHLVSICFLGKEKLLNCYLLDNKIQKVFSRTVNAFNFENGFSTTEEMLDIAKHKLTCSWILQENQLIKGDFSLSTNQNFCVENLPEHLIGYAFLEEMLCGGDASVYLADNVNQNKYFLPNFFGEFLGVMPPPDFKEQNEIGLIYKCDKNRYKVEYFCFDIDNKKICNIIKSP